MPIERVYASFHSGNTQTVLEELVNGGLYIRNRKASSLQKLTRHVTSKTLGKAEEAPGVISTIGFDSLSESTESSCQVPTTPPIQTSLMLSPAAILPIARLIHSFVHPPTTELSVH